MAKAKCDYVATEITECWLGLWQAIEPVCQFAVKRLFSDVAPLIERIERIREAIVENR